MKHLSLIVLFAISLSVHSQSTPWLWAKSAGGTGWEFANSVATDAAGNVYVAGYFNSNTIAFGSTTLTNSGVPSSVGDKSFDIFLAKYDNSGNVIWAKSAVGSGIGAGVIGGGGPAEIQSWLTVDASGNILSVGYFTGLIFTVGTYTLMNANPTYGGDDMYIVKYDSNGNVLWAKSAGGRQPDVANSVATDASGNVYVGGGFYGFPDPADSLNFFFAGSDTLIYNRSMPSYELVLIKYNSNGDEMWIKSAGGTSSLDGIYALAVTPSGNIIAGGKFGSTWPDSLTTTHSLTFPPYTLTIVAGSALYTSDLFLVEYDSLGNVLWAKAAGGNNQDDIYSITTDAAENIVVAGYFSSSTLAFGSTTLTNAGLSDLFLTKYDKNGNVLWAKGAEGGEEQDEAWSVTADAAGNIFVGGRFRSAQLTFDAVTLTNHNYDIHNDVFIVKYDANGNVAGATIAGGNYGDGAMSLVAGADGNIYAAGYLASSTATFGSTTLANTGAADSPDIFVAKLGNDFSGIENLENHDDIISAYPNPNSGKLQVSSKQYALNAVEIYNVLGERIHQQSFFSQTKIAMIDLGANVPKGIYVAKIYAGEKIYSESIVVQ